jgi:hypothetical protein
MHKNTDSHLKIRTGSKKGLGELPQVLCRVPKKNVL